jgi:EmrB/QacA subfamily drug resistance transporter
MEPVDRQNRNLILVVTTLGAFLTPLMGSSVTIALPTIGREFALDGVLLSWVTTAYLLSVALFLVPFGRLADICGRRKICLWGFSIYTFASLLAPFSQNVTFLILSRVIQGIGASMTFSTGVAILTSIFPPSERGRVLGINVAAVYAGQSCGPFIGGLLTEYLGWRSIFLLQLPLGLLIIFFIGCKIKGEWADAEGEGFDLAGSFLYAFTLLCLMIGLTRLPDPEGLGLILSGGLGLWALVRWERRAAFPLFDIDLITGNRVFTLSNVAALIHYCATFATGFLLSLYLQWIQGLKPQEAGLVLLCQPLMQALFSPFAGRLSDRREPRIVASAGMAITALSLSTFIFLSRTTPVWSIMACLGILGFGYALFSSPNTNAVMGSVDRRYYGVASGTLGTMRSMGMILSMAIATLLFALFIGRVQIVPRLYPFFMKSLHAAFGIFTGLCLVGVFASLSRGRMRPKKD